jgi:uncharacterized protein YecE (DUF72 family)
VTAEAEWQEWAGVHKACWEVQPLIELHEGRRMQVGFEFNIFAQFPRSVTTPETRTAAFPQLIAKLQELAQRVFPAEAAVARFEVQPIETAVRLRSESEFEPEVQLTVRVFHRQEYFQAVSDGDRKRLAPLEERLKALGLKAKAWGRVS